jgi:hypothetical protein
MRAGEAIAERKFGAGGNPVGHAAAGAGMSAKKLEEDMDTFKRESGKAAALPALRTTGVLAGAGGCGDDAGWRATGSAGAGAVKCWLQPFSACLTSRQLLSSRRHRFGLRFELPGCGASRQRSSFCTACALLSCRLHC